MDVRTTRLSPLSFWVCEALLVCSTSSLVALHAQMPAASTKSHQKIHWANHALTEVRTLRELSPDLQAVLRVGTLGMDGIADRNGKYNPTDVIDSSLPMRRFLVAGLDGDTTLMAVEHSGRSWWVETTLFKKTIVERSWTLFEAPNTLSDLVNQLNSR